MPWCPQCKNEYREGITVCADCGVDLVDELPDEDEYEPKPVVILVTDDEPVGKKIVRLLRLNGIYSSALISKDSDEIPEGVSDDGDATDISESEDTDIATPNYMVIVADIEREAVDDVLVGLVEGEKVDEDRLYELVPDIEDQFEEIDNEAASKEFSELRNEASTVYVKKKDKYADLKFSGYSFIGFGVLGVCIILLSVFDVIHLFNTYSTIVMALVFAAFFAIGIASLVRAGKYKTAVNVEDEFTEQLNYWASQHLTDDVIDEWYDEHREDQENYFDITARMLGMLREEFPNINPAYLEELADERYTEYLEKSAYENPDEIPEADDVEEESVEGE